MKTQRDPHSIHPSVYDYSYKVVDDKPKPKSEYAIEDWTPRDIHSYLNHFVIGQEAAKKAVSTFVYNCVEGRQSNIMLVGQSGSGKTELFRALQKGLKTQIHIFDATQITPSGYRGTSLSSLLYGIQEQSETYSDVLVFDEVDKMISGDFGALKAHELLKLLDHDVLQLQTDDGKHQFTFDASRTSIALIGAFTDLRQKKAQKRPQLGFIQEEEPHSDSEEVTVNDLINYGVSSELCGRIQRVVTMDAPSHDTYVAIGKMTIKRISKEMQKQITVHPSVYENLAREAMAQKTGARYIRNQLNCLIDDEIYNHPNSPAYIIGYSETEVEEMNALPF